MTREEEIRNASIEVYSDIAVRPGTRILRECCRLSFQKGAKWADANPKSPWISVKNDLPCNHKELISPDKSSENLTVTEYVVVVVYGYKLLSRMYELDGKWYWETDEPTYWFPITEPPKE